MKVFFIIVLILGIGYFGWNALQTAPDESIPQAMISDNTTQTPDIETIEGQTQEAASFFDNQNIAISYTGFGPGKEHKGTIAVQAADITRDAEGKVTGSVSVDMNSITADVPAVATHLKTKDFFNAPVFPIATLSVASVSDTTLTGTLTLKGVTKAISFPITKTETSYNAEFRVNMKDFGIVQKFANEEFVVRVSVPLKK
jgi:polyisoprenoid-binding protein YceI